MPPPMEANLSLGSVKDYSNTPCDLNPPPPHIPPAAFQLCSELIGMSRFLRILHICALLHGGRHVCQESLSLTWMDGLSEIKCVCVWGGGVILWFRNSRSRTHPGTCHTFRHSSPSNPKILLLPPLTPLIHKQTSTPIQPPPSAGSSERRRRRRRGEQKH